MRACSLCLGSNGSLVAAILHQLDGLEQSAAAHVADVMVVAEALAQPSHQRLALRFHIGEQVVAPDDPLHGERSGAGQRMAQVGMPVLEEAGALFEGLEHLLAHENGPDRREAAAEPLGDGHQVGRDAFLLAGMQRARAAHAAHHLVQDQQDAVAVADLAHALEVAFDRGNASGRRAPDRFGHEGHDGIRAELLDLVFEFLGQPLAVLRRRLVGPPPAILEARRDMMHVDQQRRELLAPPFVAADGQGTQRVAVVALPAGNEVPSLRLALLHEILPRHLQRRLDGLRPAADEVDVAGAARRVRDQVFGQLFGDLRREEARVRIGQICRAERAWRPARRDDRGRGTTPPRRRWHRCSPCRRHRGCGCRCRSPPRGSCARSARCSTRVMQDVPSDAVPRWPAKFSLITPDRIVAFARLERRTAAQERCAHSCQETCASHELVRSRVGTSGHNRPVWNLKREGAFAR